MKVSKEELEAIRTVVSQGNTYGFGNLIGHLQSAWSCKLIDTYSMPEDVAIRAATGNHHYPEQMHRDIIERGEWDETGERYASKVTGDPS